MFKYSNEAYPFFEFKLFKNKNIKISLRIFNFKLNKEVLKWHRDHEDRIILPIYSFGWQIQFDNELPKNLIFLKNYKIKKNCWHRILNNKRKSLIIIVLHLYD